MGLKMAVLVPVSWGEVIDKITILEIKAERMTDPAKLANVGKELAELAAVREREFPAHAPLAAQAAELKAVNEKLWVIEDDIREARAVYVTNDERANAKRRINELLGSSLMEEKSYAAY